MLSQFVDLGFSWRCLWIKLAASKSPRVRYFDYFLGASAPKNYEKIAVIKSAASAASARGGCASSRLDHGLKFYVIWGGCASSRLILMHLARGLSSKLIIPPSVRPSVPLLGEAQNLCFCTILSEISKNHLCILQYLAPVALKTHHKIDTFFVKCSKHTIK